MQRGKSVVNIFLLFLTFPLARVVTTCYNMRQTNPKGIPNMQMPDVKKKQIAALVDLNWFPEIDAAALKYGWIKSNGEPDRAKVLRQALREYLDGQGYQITEDDALWVLEQVRKNKKRRVANQKTIKEEN